MTSLSLNYLLIGPNSEGSRLGRVGRAVTRELGGTQFSPNTSRPWVYGQFLWSGQCLLHLFGHAQLSKYLLMNGVI